MLMIFLSSLLSPIEIPDDSSVIFHLLLSTFTNDLSNQKTKYVGVLDGLINLTNTDYQTYQTSLTNFKNSSSKSKVARVVLPPIKILFLS